MLIERRSPFSGKVHQMDLPITEEQLERWIAGELAQKVFMNLNASQREFIISGITPDEWNEAFGNEE